jgi:hypothetical protein
MGELSSTPEARRAVAKLIERYFVALKRELAEQTAAFWARVETALAAKDRDDKSNENKEVNKPVAD